MFTSSSSASASFQRFVRALLVIVIAACSAPNSDELESARISSVGQHLDTDSDGMDDAWETTHFGGLSQTAAGDFDSDGMTNLEEYTNGFNPTVNDALDDLDGDRYPNIVELRNSSNPNDANSKPTSTYVVNAAGGGTHTTVGAAIASASSGSNNFPIIGVAAGTYTASGNFNLSINSTRKPLIIGLDGAAKTIIDGGGTSTGWSIYSSAVVASLTFQRISAWTIYTSLATSSELRVVDLVVKDNTASTSYAGGLHVAAGGKVTIVGSTFLNNTGYANHIYIGSGTTTIANTVLWGSASTSNLVKASFATLTTNYCLVKGQTLSGTGNLSGTTDPKLGKDGHVLFDSPLRAAGGTVAQSRIDMDGELRPVSSPDIGADQFFDSDGDSLADQWEIAYAGTLSTLTSLAQDADGDGLTNQEEVEYSANPLATDTDGDSLSDGDEVHIHGSNPSMTDTDGDGMPDAWEITYGLSPSTSNGFEDADGDRYPNIFECVNSTNPTDSASVPTPNFVVNGAGGGTHTNIQAAINAANIANGAYQIIGVAAGIYRGQGVNLVTLPSTKPKFLIIGLAGAANTIIDGTPGPYGGNDWGWQVNNAAVISSLTFRKTLRAIYVNASASSEVRLVDLIVRDNAHPSWATGVYVHSAASVHVVGSTFLNNTGWTAGAEQIYFAAGTGTLTNTVVWGKTAGPMVAKASSASMTTNYSLVKGQTLTGTGNLSGSTDPKLRTDVHLRSNSPLRGAGGTVAQSRIDMDGELRPSSGRDIGVDQFVDADTDNLPDAWEVAKAGNTTTIVGSADDDNDGLSNVDEYNWESDYLSADTDRDGAKDGIEVAYGLNPLVADSDDVVSDLNHDGLIDSLGFQFGWQYDTLDDDGDGVSNADEILMCTNPFRVDTDGDGVSDDVDVFPRDPLMSTLPTNPSDTTPPVITLTAPSNAVEQ